MNKIEEIEDLINVWEAAQKQSESTGFIEHARRIGCRISGLRAALDIIKRPSNTQIQMDAYCTIHGTKLRQNDGTFQICPGCIGSHH